jgi:hypothetical protein
VKVPPTSTPIIFIRANPLVRTAEDAGDAEERRK